MRWTPDTLAASATGRIVRRGTRDIAGAFVDSRSPVPGGLFVPIVAARDGHDFIADAIAGGAAAVLVAKGRAAPEGDVTVVEVDDTLRAFQRIATARRSDVAGPVVAISGSNGKTTTRSMIAAVLASARTDVLCTRGNLNNHIGVPLTLTNEPHAPSAMVIELGMNAPGENDLLASIVQPDIAVITSIALEHLEFMGSIEAIAAAEAEPITRTREGGVVVLPSDEPLLRPHLPAADRGLSVLRFGPDASADVRILDVQQRATTRAKILAAAYGELDVELQTFGLHNARNAAAAIAVGMWLELPPQPMLDALRSVVPVGDRGRTQTLGPHLLVADCYNANPGSVSSALASIAALVDGRRRIAVLGDMLELGPTELELHAEVGRRVAQAGVRTLVAFGPRSRETARTAADAGVDVLATEDPDEAVAFLHAALVTPSVVLVKGSRGMKLERVIDRLLARSGP
ncbi:MAG TPA: UDP-N-acetylmuramoyl-tripeptide--D-alanyl-D-alanine ligase [Nannocystaceae bacterium]|nr:UDP-N-acetylmuramoyl-tripeptide--D-alanyl-D-alanine ligase [Nannocystaceae bacterium]